MSFGSVASSTSVPLLGRLVKRWGQAWTYVFLSCSYVTPSFCNRHHFLQNIVKLAVAQGRSPARITSSKGGIGLAETQIALYFLLPGPMFTNLMRGCATGPCTDMHSTLRGFQKVFAKALVSHCSARERPASALPLSYFT